MLSQGLGVYHIANQNTSRGSVRKMRVLAQRKRQTVPAASGDCFLSKIWQCGNLAFLRDRKNLSTLLPCPYKDLEWHKGKKHQLRRHLSLLLRDLPVTSRSQSSSHFSKRRPYGVLLSCAAAPYCFTRHESAAVVLPIETGAFVNRLATEESPE